MGSSSSKAASGIPRSRSGSSCLGFRPSDHHLFLEEGGDDGSISNRGKVIRDYDHDNTQTTIEEEEDNTQSSDHSTTILCDATPCSSSRSRFTFIPPSFSFKLTRASSFSSSPRLPFSFLSTTTPCATDVAAAAPDSSLHPQDNHFLSYQDNVPIYNVNTPDIHHHTSSTQNSQIDFVQSRLPSNNRHVEPVERSIRFSRALSVGRLRDRVLRRSSFTDARVQQDRQPVGGFSSPEDARSQPLGGNTDVSTLPSPHSLSTVHNNQDDQLETSRPREARHHDLMEHRTDFLERRRRIRSQVRALQRLGSRFENLSGHERSCILAGQHRSSLCTCRTSNRARNPDDNTSARASISRIVMLAEALFEVLDEIHQQSVVLSSRTSVSSFGSIPAPKEVVESMPLKIYTKLHKHQLEDVPQCYICLVEYEEGDSMRILPCHHEFHRPCIDKWLKEIHRVCPLCRGDVCRTP